MRGIIRELEPDGADATVIDMEAGLEHLKRGTPRHTDAMVVVAEPYFRSLETATRTAEMAGELGIPTVGVVANKVRGGADEDRLRSVIEERGHALLGMIPYDEAVLEADARPAALIDVAPEAPAVRAVAEVGARLLDGRARR